MKAHFGVILLSGVLSASCASTVGGLALGPAARDGSADVVVDASMADVTADLGSSPDVYRDPRCPSTPCWQHPVLRFVSGGTVLVYPDGRTVIWGTFPPSYFLPGGGAARTPIPGSRLPVIPMQFETWDQHGCVLAADSSVRCWSDDDSDLGLPFSSMRNPREVVVVAQSPDITHISLRGGGTSVFMGRRYYSAPGRGASGRLGLVFNFELPLPIVEEYFVDNGMIASLLVNGSIYVSRRYSEGAPLVGHDDEVIAPRFVPLPMTMGQILSLSDTYGAAVMRDGSVMEWGRTGGVLYRNDNNPGAPLTRVPELTDVAYIGQGSQFSCALSRHGTVRCWGSSTQGQLGIGILDDPGRLDRPPVILHPPGPDVALPPVRELRVGSAHACALTMDDEVYCWGDTRGGAVGNGVTWRAQPTPVRLNLPR